jgi:hypothetical protein
MRKLIRRLLMLSSLAMSTQCQIRTALAFGRTFLRPRSSLFPRRVPFCRNDALFRGHRQLCSLRGGSEQEHIQRITYLTDVEGDREYLTRYVEQSRVLCFSPTTPRIDFPYSTCIDFYNSTDVLVYGGDIWDQGGHDLYACRQLVDLKERYPDRVHLILGNRDINKMRVKAELGSSGKAPPHQGVYWLRGTGRIGDPDNGTLSDHPVERLQWMLGQTMGSPRAFGYRKLELQRERGDVVTDEDVVESYRTSCDPAGEMGRYLANAHLAVRLGEVLFVHGSLPLTPQVLEERDDWKDLSFAMPWQNHVVGSIDDWLLELENFCRTSIDTWINHTDTTLWSLQGGYSAEPFYTKLLQYGMGWTPDRLRNPTIVVRIRKSI